MLISIDWIKDFVNVPDLPSKELGSRFTLATAEVEDVISIGDFLERIVVAEILSFEKHPEADKLNLVTFKISDSDIRKVVCGASNVKVGIKIPFAPLGTKLPNGLLLEAKKIRGILSEGMLCSEEELGIASESDGIMELPSDTPIGLSMLQYLKVKKDTVLDVDNKSLTHRPDLWGHYGIAREFSAIFRTPLKNQFSSEWQQSLLSKMNNDKSPITIRLEGESSCLGYMGLSIQGVTVTETPPWIVNRLKTCGLRSINSIVDISNYVMLELGFPLHIFDRDLISGTEVVISELKDSTKFKTLDGIERILVPGDTVISDSKGPLVLAGIMGGERSSVSLNTKNLFIEVANWKAAFTRKTSTRLGLRTDSSQRYEKSLDNQLMKRTLLRTLELILQLNPSAKVIGSIEYAGKNLENFTPVKIQTHYSKLKKVLGKEISNEEINNIFSFLDFKNNSNGDVLNIEVPSYRSTKDVECEADLVEELGRIIGFDNIDPISPLDGISPVKLSEIQKVQRRIRDFLTIQGRAFEVMTYPLIGEELLKKVSWPSKQNLNLYNSISIDHSIMRPSLIPSLLEAAELNAKYHDRFRFFELGRSYVPNEIDFSKESLHLGAVFYNKETTPFIDLANLTANLFNSLGLNFDFIEPNAKFQSLVLPSDWSGVHPVEHRSIRVMGKVISSIFSIHPIILKNLKIKGHLSFMLIDLSLFNEIGLREKTKYKPLNKFPISTFDWTVVTKLDSPIGEVQKVAAKAKLKELVSVEILDLFVSREEKYVTLRATFADENATLSSDFLKGAEKLLVESTNKAGFLLKN
jgi:phenylalanyl-tRNA synthetase beta chain